MKPLFIRRKGEVFLGSDGPRVEGLPEIFQGLYPDLSPKYIDPLSLMAGIAAARALGDDPWSDEVKRDFSVVLGTAFGSMDSMMEFDGQAVRQGPQTVNPMDFPNTVANAAGSRVGIWQQLKGPNVTLTNGTTSFLDAVGFAWEAANDGLFRYCLVGAAERVPPPMKRWAPGGHREGAVLLLASLENGPGEGLFRVEDHFSLQLDPRGGLPAPWKARWGLFWEGADWLAGFPEALLPALTPPVKERLPSQPADSELGLGGWEGLGAFLASSRRAGVLAAFSAAERKLSLLKVAR